MSDGDDIERTLLEGTPYEQASTLEDRLFPFAIETKILLCVVTLAVSSLLAPLLFVSRHRIERFEGTETLSETLSPALSSLALLGVLTTAVFGLALVGLLVSIRSRSLTMEAARRLVRIEDFVLFFAMSGILSVLVSILFAAVGALSVRTTERLYASGVTVYSAGGPVAVDSRFVSGLGLVFALVLSVALHRYRRK